MIIIEITEFKDYNLDFPHCDTSLYSLLGEEFEVKLSNVKSKM
jgi:hypothetical protein